MENRNKESAIRLVNRVFWPRQLGLLSGSIVIAVHLYRQNSSVWLWIGLVVWAFFWPSIARVWAMRSSNQFKAEIRNLYLDAFLIGFWVPVISFSLVPSIALLGMHLLSIISVLGFRSMMFGLVFELAGALLAVLIFGLNINVEADNLLILASIPMITMYPLLVGYNAFKLAHKLSAKQKVLRKLNRIDVLTGLYNRSYLDEQLERTFLLSQRSKSAASIIFIDVDHFKKVNDRYGHIIGDKVLQNISKILMKCARETDLCGRYGGEEFCILMPDTDRLSARIFAERLRAQVNDAILESSNEVRGTISLGVAEISDNMKNYTDWLMQADTALYKAKQQGRNQTILSE